MQINRIQNNTYTPQFNGFIRLQNFAKGGEITKVETSQELDKGLANIALNNVFGGNWIKAGKKEIKFKELKQYCDVISQTLGISIPRNTKEPVKVELKHFDNGYSIKSDGDYKITHIREDQLIWD